MTQLDLLRQRLVKKAQRAVDRLGVGGLKGKISDGYHTFDELYEIRKAYNAALLNEWSHNDKYDVHKSTRHYDGEECFGGGWFIVVAILPSGQISNHYKMQDWDLFQVPAVERAKYPYDGHTAFDTIKRLNDVSIAPWMTGFVI